MDNTWIFDLDNTLHDAEKKIFPLINKKINQYISEVVKINLSEADVLRQKYWDNYGATLEGLIKHHNINPKDFLKKTHTLDPIKEQPHANRIPIRKTNCPTQEQARFISLS